MCLSRRFIEAVSGSVTLGHICVHLQSSVNENLRNR